MNASAGRILGKVVALAALFCIGAPAPLQAQNKMKTSTGMVAQGLMGQTKEQQEKDDIECYRFAIEETKIDLVYVPGAINKGEKAKPLPGAPARAAIVPTSSGIKRKPKGNPKGEVVAPKKKKQKAG